MKHTQWVVAICLLVAVVFIVSFAMNYLDGTVKPSTGGEVVGESKELYFQVRTFPPDGMTALDREDKERNFVDYWFRNLNDTPVKFGLQRANCKCTSVHAFLLGDQGFARLLGEAVALWGVASTGPFAASTLHTLGLPAVQAGIEGKELLALVESVEVPPMSMGWVRLSYHGEKPGKQTVGANFWMDRKDGSKIATLDLRLNFYEPVRVQPTQQIGTFREQDLATEVKRHFICWSSTRSILDLEVYPAIPRKNSAADPFVLGKPERMTWEESRQLEQELNPPTPNQAAPLSGPVMSAYRIPFTLLPIAPDGKTPLDVGPFRRRVMVRAKDTSAEPQSTLLLGRVRGVVEIGNDDDAGEINFQSFPRVKGRRESLGLNSGVPGLKLTFDRERTPAFLTATLEPKQTSGEGRQSWTLRVQVLPNQASGPFPRKEDPAYEDSAVYLKAEIPNKGIRPVRIAVQGTATEG